MAKSKAYQKIQEQIDQLERERNARTVQGGENENKLFSAYIESLKQIVQASDRQYVLDRHGNYTNMTSGDHNALKGYYQVALNQSDLWTKSIGTDPNAAAQWSIVKTLQPLLSADLNMLQSLDANAPGPLATAIRNARVRTVDIQDRDLAKAGANLSNRVPLTITEGDGAHKGYFTADVRPTPDGDIAAALKQACDDSPEYAQILTAIASTAFFQSVSYSYNDLDSFEASRDRWSNALVQANVHPNMISKLNKDDDFFDAAFKYATKVADINNKYRVLDAAGIDPSGGIDKRNSAMSTVAGLLGMPNLIAKSTSMNIVKDGKTISGTFMENAKGIDCLGAPSSSPLYQCNPDTIDKSTLYRDIADMQVLDFICGNTDRHFGNVFYQVDSSNPKQPVLTGLMGIDNDCSFGTNTSRVMRLVPPQSMKVISEKTANIVWNLNQNTLKTALRHYNFNAAELNALDNRLQQVQKGLSMGSLTVVKDSEWGALDPRSVQANPSKVRGKFENLFDIVDSTLGSLSRRKAQVLVKEQLDLGAAKKTETTRAIDQDISPLSPLGLRTNQEKLTQLLSDLKSSDLRFFRGSQQFKDMKKSLETLCKVNERTSRDSSPMAAAHLEQCYKALKETSAAYLEFKGTGSSNKTTQSRIDVAKALHAFSSEQTVDLFDRRLDREQTELSESYEAVHKAVQQANQKLAESHKLAERKNVLEASLKYVNQFKPNDPMFIIGNQAHLARIQLFQLSDEKTLTPQKQEALRSNVATLLTYDKLVFEKQASNGGQTPLKDHLSNPGALEQMVNHLKNDPSFQSLTNAATPQFAEKIASKGGIRSLNQAYTKLSAFARNHPSQSMNKQNPSVQAKPSDPKQVHNPGVRKM